MMARKKRIAVAVVISVIIVLIIAIAMILLYLNTDLFKSNQTLFMKYLGKNFENISAMKNDYKPTEYEESLNNIPYSENVVMQVNHTKNIGTTSESTDNAINKLKIIEEGQVDKSKQYDEKTIKLLQGEETKMQVEYIQEGNTYGLRFSDLFNQYVLAENSNVRDLLKKAGYTEEQVANIPDTIDINLLNAISFTAEEKEQLKEKYMLLLVQGIDGSNFEKQSKQIISINQQDILANAYIMKMTKEQLNSMYISVLENIKQDEIILGKIEKLQEQINILNLKLTNKIDIKDKFVSNIDKAIDKISKNNIGNDETKIIVYESGTQTVRTSIQGTDYEVSVDYLPMDGKQFAEFKVTRNQVETIKVTLNQDAKKSNLVVLDNRESTPVKITLERSKEEKENSQSTNISVVYEKDTDKVEGTITKNTNIINSIEKQVKLDESSSVKLNNMNKEQVQAILNRVKEGLKNKKDTLKGEIDVANIEDTLKVVGIIKENNILEGNGVSETEKNRFNSSYEILQGENLTPETVLNVINTIQNNLINMQVVSSDVLKLEINKAESNPQIAETLKNFIKEEQGVNYNVKVEYDEVGLVKYIVLTMVKPE